MSQQRQTSANGTLVTYGSGNYELVPYKGDECQIPYLGDENLHHDVEEELCEYTDNEAPNFYKTNKLIYEPAMATRRYESLARDRGGYTGSAYDAGSLCTSVERQKGNLNELDGLTEGAVQYEYCGSKIRPGGARYDVQESAASAPHAAASRPSGRELLDEMRREQRASLEDKKTALPAPVQQSRERDGPRGASARFESKETEVQRMLREIYPLPGLARFFHVLPTVERYAEQDRYGLNALQGACVLLDPAVTWRQIPHDGVQRSIERNEAADDEYSDRRKRMFELLDEQRAAKGKKSESEEYLEQYKKNRREDALAAQAEKSRMADLERRIKAEEERERRMAHEAEREKIERVKRLEKNNEVFLGRSAPQAEARAYSGESNSSNRGALTIGSRGVTMVDRIAAIREEVEMLKDVEEDQRDTQLAMHVVKDRLRKDWEEYCHRCGIKPPTEEQIEACVAQHEDDGASV